jgi:hypothetical protein
MNLETRRFKKSIHGATNAHPTFQSLVIDKAAQALTKANGITPGHQPPKLTVD